MQIEWQLSKTSVMTLVALKLKQTEIHAGIGIVPSLSSVFFELCLPANDCSVKVPLLYFFQSLSHCTLKAFIRIRFSWS